MRIGVFADIHGNIYAFERVWKALKKESCDQYFLLGDICGYYYYQNEIIEILRDIKNLITICGNHDDIFLKMLKDDSIEKEYTKKYGKSLKMLKKSIKMTSLKFLKNLPKKYIVNEYKIGVFHGSPWDYLNGYVYPTDSLSSFQQLPYQLVFLGHTHHSMDRTINKIRIVNPGSCGQPRDCNQPSYVVFDLKSKKAKFKRINYDVSLMVKDVIQHNEKNKYLIDVLKRVRKLNVR